MEILSSTYMVSGLPLICVYIRFLFVLLAISKEPLIRPSANLVHIYNLAKVSSQGSRSKSHNEFQFLHIYLLIQVIISPVIEDATLKLPHKTSN